MRIYRAIILVFVSIVFFQCQKELSHVGGPDSQPTFPAPITANIQGNIEDENGQPASGVTVTIGNKIAISDNKGFFRVEDAGLDKNASLVTAEKPGYFKAYRTFMATEGINQVGIKLIKRNLAGSVDASAGGMVSLNNGMKVTLPANGVILESSGANYNGTVNVFADFIDPTLPDIDRVVPGSFIANDKNGRRVTLASFGMMAVELESPGGQKLQIKPGFKATLTNPIPASLLSSAPAEMPLWYINEKTGIWTEEGKGVKNGNDYVGEVSHFSFWNLDIPMDAFRLTVTIKNSDGAPMVHARVRVQTLAAPLGFTYGYTNENGLVSGWVPANVPLKLDVLDDCHASALVQNLDAMNRDTDLGTIAIPANSTSVITIKGKLLDCNSAAVTNGFAIVEFGNDVHFAEVDGAGNFSTNFLRCSTSPSTYSITGVDDGSMQQGTAFTGSISGTIMDAGSIAACGTNIDQYLNYTMDGININLTEPADSLTAFSFPDSAGQFKTYIGGIRMQNQIVTHFVNFQFTHPGLSPGNYAVFDFSNSSFPASTIMQPFNVNLTNFPISIGQFYEGSFSGSFSAGTVHTVSGTFRIRRTQ